MMHKVQGLMGKQISCQNTAPSSSLAMHKNLHSISKAKPKIRIIHIVTPEIIETDAANFRELVQRLTGKPTDGPNCSKRRPSSKFPPNRKMEAVSTAAGGLTERIKGEEEIWEGANMGGGFLGGFAEFDHSFVQELNRFPFMEDTVQMDAA